MPEEARMQKAAQEIKHEILATVNLTLSDLRRLGAGRKVLKDLAPEYPGRVRIELRDKRRNTGRG